MIGINKINQHFVIIAYSFLVGALASMLGLHGDVAAVISETIRQNEGQKNFIDYSIHFPFLTSMLMKLSSWILNPTKIFVIYSGLINLIYSYLIFKIALIINSSNAMGVALISASWFIPTIGGYYYDNVAIAIGFFQFYILLKNKNSYVFKNIIIGLLCVLVVMIKQSTGLAIIIPISIYFLISSYNNNLLKQIFFISFGIIIGIILVWAHLETLSPGYSKIYFTELYNVSAIYAENTKRVSIKNLIYVIIFPYNINIFSSNSFSLGVILFYPIIIIQYLFYFAWIKLDIDKLNFYIFVLIGTILTEFIVGRGSINLAYFLGLQLLCLFSIKKSYL